jgi:hypothetical protein
MDEELTLHELRRLEAERKLRAIPAQVLETAWVLDAQIEAVIDAVLAVTYAGDAAAYAHARHVGEWCARIASVLPTFGPGPQFARRVGLLADLDPSVLERIPELKHLAPGVRHYQALAMQETVEAGTISMIVATADEFDSRIKSNANGYMPPPGAVLRLMSKNASDVSRPVIEALSEVVRSSRSVRVA